MIERPSGAFCTGTRICGLLALIALVLAFGAKLNAQLPTPPPQPKTGPGGNSYLYSTLAEFGPYYALPNNTSAANVYYIFEPAKPVVASLPVVLFLHGFLKPYESTGYDSPMNYLGWIRQLAFMGNTVIYPIYDGNAPQSAYYPYIENSYTAALTLLESGTVPGLITPSSDAEGLQVGCAGHSLGAYFCFLLAQNLTISPVTGAPVPRAIAAMTLGTGGNLSTDFSRISPAVSVVMAKGDQDTMLNDDGVSDAVWASLTSIPAGQKDYLEVVTDSHGSPAQVGDHWFPMTNGFMDTAAIDDRDFNVVWKLSVGIFDCVFQGANCDYALGHGSANQIGMGNWSDGVAVTPLLLVDGPGH